ncbi:MAG: hypothetical protein WC273_04820 [Dehalococcoidia bacterium]
MIDSGSDLDLEAAIQNIQEAEVVCLYFPTFNQTLLVDARTAPSVGPMMAVVPMTRSVADRIRSLRRLRPQLPRPESITMIPWGRRVGSLVDCGLWTHILARVNDPACAEDCMKRLRTMELSEFRDAIIGRAYQSIWSRTDAKREIDEP